jgi:hypothetical protein
VQERAIEGAGGARLSGAVCLSPEQMRAIISAQNEGG